MTAIPWAAGPPIAPSRRRSLVTLGRWAPPDPWTVGVPVLAAGLVSLGIALGWRGADLPAQIFRVEAVRRHGLALWDSQWFAGHWMLGYSVLEPAEAALIGFGLLSVLSAAAAASAFQRLVAGHFAPGAARAASLVFAVSVVVETAIGQIPFLAGEAAGLWCCVALARRRPLVAAGAAVYASLLSPLAGAFVVLAAGAWLVATWWPRVASWPSRSLLGRPGVGTAVAILLGVGITLGAVGLLFPGQGPMPYPTLDWGWEILLASGLFLVTPRSERVVRTGTVGFMVAATASVVVPSALGGNIGRVEDCLALPLAVAMLWSRRRLALVALAVPLALSQWGPAWGAMTSDAGHPWMHQGYYQPLVRWLHHAGGPPGRLEVVPTADHWESAYVAPTIALARGWERQLDVPDNPIFYQPGELTPTTYLHWLLDNGVRYVALPAAPLDYAGAAEGRLVAAGVPGLRLVSHTAKWQVYRVDGATGIVSGPGYLSGIDGSQMSVVVHGAGTVEVRVHDNPAWKVASGPATIQASPDGWILVEATMPGTVHLSLGLPVP